MRVLIDNIIIRRRNKWRKQKKISPYTQNTYSPSIATNTNPQQPSQLYAIPTANKLYTINSKPHIKKRIQFPQPKETSKKEITSNISTYSSMRITHFNSASQIDSNQFCSPKAENPWKRTSRQQCKRQITQQLQKVNVSTQGKRSKRNRNRLQNVKNLIHRSSYLCSWTLHAPE